MRILIHNMNNTLFPDADPNSIAWTGPPPEIIIVQSLLYACLATSLFSAFLAMLGKQWVTRYLRNHGGSAADKSRVRQQKLDGLQKWHFHLVIESLPVMLQLALLLLGCALSRYLWMISHTVAGVIVVVMLFGVTSYIFLTLAATLYHNCPYQTPPSILTRTITRYLTHSDAKIAHLLQSCIVPLPSIKNLRGILGHLCSGVCSVFKGFCCIPAVVEEVEHTPLATVVLPPTWIFKDIPVDWDTCRADAQCISWVLHSSTDTDMIFSTVRFAADMVWYPEIAGALSPCVLLNLFFDCLVDGQVAPGKSEHASSIGMALASVLSIHLIMEPNSQVLRELCEPILSVWVPSPDPTFIMVTSVLRFVAGTVGHPIFGSWELLESIPDHLSTMQKLWLGRVILQTLWRWRCVQKPTRIIHFSAMVPICQRFSMDNDHVPTTLQTNSFLLMAISLGLQIGIHDLYAPNTKYVVPHFCNEVCSLNSRDALETSIDLFFQQLQICIRERRADQWYILVVLSALAHLSPFQALGGRGLGILLIDDLLNSRYPEGDRYQMASTVVNMLGKWFDSVPSPVVQHSWIPTLLNFLSLCEKFYPTESPPYPGFIVLHILSASLGCDGFCEMVLPVLISTLQPTHPLQSRHLALKVFDRFSNEWFSSQVESIPHKDLKKLVQALGDPFQFPDLPLQDGQSMVTVNYKPMMVVLVLIKFASSNLWQSYLHHSNFTSCEEIMSTNDGKRAAIRCMFDMAARSWFAHLRTPASMIAAIRHLENLQCLNTAEVVLLWAWTTGVVDPADHDAWELIGRNTLKFYQAHGMGRLATLSQHITDTTMVAVHIQLLVERYGCTPCRVQQLPIPVTQPVDDTDLCISQTCQLRRLYCLFGCDPAMWREMVVGVGVEVGAEGVVDVLSRWPVIPSQFTDWICDYP